MPDIEEDTVAAPTEAVAAEPPKKGRKKKEKAASDAPKRSAGPRITDDVVLKAAEGYENLVKRPKYRTIVAAFGEGKTVKEALTAAASELGGKLKSASFEKDSIGYLRSYLGELIAAKALIREGAEASAEAPTEAPAEA